VAGKKKGEKQMKYNLIKFIRNTKEQYVAQTSTYDAIESAKVAYHQSLAALHNAPDVKVATVKIEDEFGHELAGFNEIVDHTPEPEPEPVDEISEPESDPEPEPEPEPESEPVNEN
jgi:hypothetical protein